MLPQNLDLKFRQQFSYSLIMSYIVYVRPREKVYKSKVWQVKQIYVTHGRQTANVSKFKRRKIAL